MWRTAPAEAAACGLALLLFALAWPPRERVTEECAFAVVRAPGEVACAAGPDGLPRLEGPLRRLFGRPIDPNHASAATLETLPWVGPARAGAIVRERCRGRFASIADLARVPGIGPKRIAAIEPFLAIDGGLALAGQGPLESGTCPSSCESGGVPGPRDPDCRAVRAPEARQ